METALKQVVFSPAKNENTPYKMEEICRNIEGNDSCASNDNFKYEHEA